MFREQGTLGQETKPMPTHQPHSSPVPPTATALRPKPLVYRDADVAEYLPGSISAAIAAKRHLFHMGKFLGE